MAIGKAGRQVSKAMEENGADQSRSGTVERSPYSLAVRYSRSSPLG